MYDVRTWMIISGQAKALRLTTVPLDAVGTGLTSAADALTYGTTANIQAAASNSVGKWVVGILVTDIATDADGGQIQIYDGTTTTADPKIEVYAHAVSSEQTTVYIPLATPVFLQPGGDIAAKYGSVNAGTAGTCKVKLFCLTGIY